MNEIPSSVLNAQFFSKLASNDPALVKEAAEAATDYTRLTLRDEGIVRKVLPPQPITAAECDTQLDTDMPVKIIEKEVEQPLATTVPYGTLPVNQEMNMKKYRVDFARLMTKNFVKDMAQVATWSADIRNIFKDNAIKDMMTEEDVTFFTLVDSIVSSDGNPGKLGNPAVGAAQGNSPSSLTGKVQFYDFTAANKNPLGVTGFSRDTLVESTKILSKAHSLLNAGNVTPIRLHTDLVVMNVNTGKEILKFDHDEIGGSKSQDNFYDGLKDGVYLGHKHIFTLKDDVIPDGYAYYFAAPQFLGRFLEMEAPTIFMELRAFMLEFFAYSCIGLSIGNPYGCAKVRYF